MQRCTVYDLVCNTAEINCYVDIMYDSAVNQLLIIAGNTINEFIYNYDG